MRIWESTLAMTVVDLAILTAALVAGRALHRRSGRLVEAQGLGPRLIGVGLAAMAALFAADLFAMWILPLLTSPVAARAAMTRMHLALSWPVLLLAALAISGGLVVTLRDVGELERRREAGETLHQSIVSSLEEFIVRWKPDGTRTFVNDAYCRHFGQPREALLGTSFMPLVAEEDRAMVRRKIAALSPEAPSATGEHRVLQPDGSIGWQEWTDHAFFDEELRLVELQSVGRDVTHMKAAEEALRRSEAKYRAVFDASVDGLVIRRLRDGTLIDLNPAMAELHGWSREELLRMPMEEYVPAESLARFALDMEAVRRGERRDTQGQGVRRDGTTFDLEGFFVPFVHGDEAHVLGVLRDVTKRKRAEAALRESEERYRRIFETTAIGMTIRRVADLALLTVNPAMAAMFGYTVEEFLELEPADYFTVAEGGPTFAAMQETVSRGETYSFNRIEGIRRDGGRIFVSGSFAPFPLAGEPHVLGSVFDETARHEAAAERQRAFEEIARLKDELERERDYLREEVTLTGRFGEIIGDSPAMQQVLARVEAVARTDANVLIQGESGVGKELVARAIHAASDRRSGPLVRVNCPSIPRELFESEFFGHVKGAFTGAHRDRVGRFQLAHGGTLFLDEVSEIPPELQAKLLRVLQEGEFQRVGEETTRQVDVRIIAASNRGLKVEIMAERFREDLYYRLSVFPIEVPPLRDRREDILPLAQHFVRRFCRQLNRRELPISQFQAGQLLRHHWPGNVRELQNVVEQAVILSPGERLRLDLALPGAGSPPPEPAARPPADAGFVTVAELKERERQNLVAALEHAEWKVSGPGGAAELLGLKPSTLSYQMKTMGIEKPS